jgi:hypothetical protein
LVSVDRPTVAGLTVDTHVRAHTSGQTAADFQRRVAKDLMDYDLELADLAPPEASETL